MLKAVSRTLARTVLRRRVCRTTLVARISRYHETISAIRYPPIARKGVFAVSTWPIGCDTPSPFSGRFPLGEHAKWRCNTPPPQKDISAKFVRYPMKTKQIACDTPLRDTISHWAAKRSTPLVCTLGILGKSGEEMAFNGIEQLRISRSQASS